MEARAPAPPLPIPIPEPPPTAPSLPPTQFEQTYGPGAEGLLQYVPDNPVYTPEQHLFALLVLGGQKDITKLDEYDQDVLDDITQRMIHEPTQTTKKAREAEAERVKRLREIPPGSMLHKDVEVLPEEHPDYEHGTLPDHKLPHPEFGE